MDEKPTVSTHVLDTERGAPAQGIEVVLYRIAPGGDREVGRQLTDDDGRVVRLLGDDLERGDYRIEFRLSGAFFGTVALAFKVVDPTRSYHVPLLIAPYSIASYRGS